MNKSKLEKIIQDTLEANGYGNNAPPSEEMASIIAYEIIEAGVRPPVKFVEFLGQGADGQSFMVKRLDTGAIDVVQDVMREAYNMRLQNSNWEE